MAVHCHCCPCRAAGRAEAPIRSKQGLGPAINWLHAGEDLDAVAALRLEPPNTAQEAALRSHCSAARAAYNWAARTRGWGKIKYLARR